MRNHRVDPSVAIEVADGQSPTNPRLPKKLTAPVRNVLETSIAPASVKLRSHSVGLIPQPGSVIDMSIRHDQIQPAVVVTIQKRRPKPERLPTCRAKTASACGVLKREISPIEVQGVRVSEKMGEEQIGEPVSITVSDGDSHAGLSEPVFIESDRPRQGAIFKPRHSPESRDERGSHPLDWRTEKKIGLSVVCDVNLRFQISVEVNDRNAKTFPVQPVDAARFRTVDQSSGSVRNEEHIVDSVKQCWRTTGVAVRASFFRAEPGRLVRLIQIIHDIQVEVPVSVEVRKSRARAPLRNGGSG